MLNIHKIKSQNEIAFENVIARANILAERNNSKGLIDLIKIILRPIQAIHMRDAYLKPDHNAIEPILCASAFGFNEEITYTFLSESIVLNKSIYPTLNLSSEIILPTSWNPHSIVEILGMIGENKEMGQFRQNNNHLLSWIYPLYFGFVENGNHSIIQGIINGEGELIPEDMFDISMLVKIIHYDGKNWINSNTGKIVGTPLYYEFGWVWEIGRLLSQIQPSPYINITINSFTHKKP